MKNRLLATCMALIMLLSAFGCASAENVETPMSTFLAHTQVVSTEAVELHIGVFQDKLAYNYKLEMAFLRQYPNARIIYHQLSSEQLAAYLMNQESTLDLLILTHQMMRDYSAKGLLCDFYQTDLLSQWPEEWIDIRQQAEIAGALYGFPQRLEVSYWQWYSTLAKAADVDQPSQVWTWEDFVDMCQNLPYDLNGDGANDFYLTWGWGHRNLKLPYMQNLMEQYFHQVIAPGGQFETPEFEQVMKMFMDIYTSGALEPFGASRLLLNGDHAVLMTELVGSTGYLLSLDQHLLMLAPVLDVENPQYMGSYYSFCMPRTAPNQELAIAFLQSALEPELQDVFDQEVQSFTKARPNYCIANDMDVSFTQNEKYGMHYVVDNIGNYRVYPVDLLYPLNSSWGKHIPEYYDLFIFKRERFMPDDTRWTPIAILWYDLLTQYVDGQMTWQAMAQALDARWAMMQGE